MFNDITCKYKNVSFYQANLDKICMLRISDSDHSMNFLYQLLLFVIVKIHVPLR